jgi:predicted phage baseplate assembly protein
MNFSGTITSDFMKLAPIALNRRVDLINFAATDFLSLRDSLIDYVKAVYPDDYKYFVESDLGMMFIELAAYMGAVMSMKADMLANENYIATAKQRASVKKLLELIGIRMRGPLSAAADAQITFDSDLTTVGSVSIGPAQRTFQVLSPEDGAQLTYTLYKVVNGLVNQATRNATIVLDPASEGLGDEKNVFQNLVVQEGSLVLEGGEFAATEGQKTVPLTDGPVVEGSIEVFIDSPNSDSNGAYSEVDSIYFASGADDKIFEVVYDEFYNATVVFGTGVAGISPPDSASYSISYRVGGGTRGNLEKDALAASVVGTSGVNSYNGTIRNTSKATGGSNAETIEHAKKYAPLTFRRQDRLVTLTDYSTFANTFISTFGTVGKATAATRNAYSSANTIDIYLLEKASDLQLQRATSNFKTQLLAAMNEKKMMTDDIVIVDGLIRTLDLVCTIRIDQEQQENEDTIKAKVRNKILNYLSIDNTEFGEDLIVSDLNRQIFEVDEVRFSTLDNVGQDIRIDFNEIIQLNNLTINVEYLA